MKLLPPLAQDLSEAQDSKLAELPSDAQAEMRLRQRRIESKLDTLVARTEPAEEVGDVVDPFDWDDPALVARGMEALERLSAPKPEPKPKGGGLILLLLVGAAAGAFYVRRHLLKDEEEAGGRALLPRHPAQPAMVPSVTHVHNNTIERHVHNTIERHVHPTKTVYVERPVPGPRGLPGARGRPGLRGAKGARGERGAPGHDRGGIARSNDRNKQRASILD